MATPEFTTEEGEEEIFDISPDDIELTPLQIKQVNVLYNKILNNPSIHGGTLVTGSGNKVLKFTPTDGLWLGNTKFSSAPFRVTMEGALTASSLTITGASIDGTSTIGGRLASTLATAIDVSGHFADAAISTATSTILGSFTFGVSGALQIGTYENGVTGDVKISPTGILGRDKTGATTFSINGETGVAVLNGLVVGTNVGIGTAEDSAGVTTIIGSTVTTGFVNALSITAGSISASDITAGTIDAEVVTISNLTVGTNVGLGTAEDSAGVTTIVGNTITSGYITALSLVVGTEIGLGTAEDSAGVTTIVGDTITSGYIQALSLVVGTEIGLGTAQDSAGVTTIVGNTVTTGFVNALSITAGSIAAENISAGTITGSKIQTDAVNNFRLVLYDSEDAVHPNALFFINASNNPIAGMGSDVSGNLGIGCDGNLTLSPSGSLLIDDIDLDGSITMDAGETVDGVDISAHAANASAHHSSTSNSLAITPATVDTGSGMISTSGTVRAGLIQGDTGASVFNAMNLSTSGEINMLQEIKMNDDNISEVNNLGFTAVSSNPGSAGQMCYYVSGGTYQLRVNINGTVYSVNLTNES